MAMNNELIDWAERVVSFLEDDKSNDWSEEIAEYRAIISGRA